jgi:hypothetical protein
VVRALYSRKRSLLCGECSASSAVRTQAGTGLLLPGGLGVRVWNDFGRLQRSTQRQFLIFPKEARPDIAGLRVPQKV